MQLTHFYAVSGHISLCVHSQVIDAYLELVRKNVRNANCYAFHAEFFAHLCRTQSGHDRTLMLKEWIENNNIPDLRSLDKLLFPIHVSDHWLLIVVDFVRRTMYVVDSLLQYPAVNRNSSLSIIRDLLLQHAKENKYERGLEQFECSILREAPQQDNGFDCGVFACVAARCIMSEKPLNYGPAEMLDFRRLIAAQLITGRL